MNERTETTPWRQALIVLCGVVILVVCIGCATWVYASLLHRSLTNA